MTPRLPSRALKACYDGLTAKSPVRDFAPPDSDIVHNAQRCPIETPSVAGERVNPLQLTKRIVIAGEALGVGGSAALLLLGALVGLSEPHEGASVQSMVWAVEIEAWVAAGALLWSICALFTVIRRASAWDLVALAASAVSQVCLFYLGMQYGRIRVWTAEPVTIAVIASMSVALAWLVSIIESIHNSRL